LTDPCCLSPTRGPSVGHNTGLSAVMAAGPRPALPHLGTLGRAARTAEPGCTMFSTSRSTVRAGLQPACPTAAPPDRDPSPFAVWGVDGWSFGVDRCRCHPQARFASRVRPGPCRSCAVICSAPARVRVDRLRP